ncbi:hypothetical protein DSO57_1032513 [Entomophthora muscae]|uniref:Uncharacterized protein n=1 Tax=Entomophthora muscae TaxID=34485 RepID=A0ACC2SD81_9FUNG|nr:hypothetical protein DSO57_1032513 [Entomophthora muscae]
MGKPLVASDFKLLKFRFLPPADKGLNLLILLHGLGDNEQNFFQLGKKLNFPQTAVVALQAPIKLPFFEEEAYMWWDSFDLNTGEELNPAHCEKSVQGCLTKVKSFLDYAVSQGWRSEAIFLFGFSQGATVALEAALSFPTKLGGVVSICGLPLRKSFENEAILPHELPILITLGDKDPKLPLSSAFPTVQKIRSLFLEHNRKAVQCEVLANKGHEMSHRQVSLYLFSILLRTGAV